MLGKGSRPQWNKHVIRRSQRRAACAPLTAARPTSSRLRTTRSTRSAGSAAGQSGHGHSCSPSSTWSSPLHAIRKPELYGAVMLRGDVAESYFFARPRNRRCAAVCPSGWQYGVVVTPLRPGWLTGSVSRHLLSTTATAPPAASGEDQALCRNDPWCLSGGTAGRGQEPATARCFARSASLSGSVVSSTISALALPGTT
jgi:hypothetical protein